MRYEFRASKLVAVCTSTGEVFSSELQASVLWTRTDSGCFGWTQELGFLVRPGFRHHPVDEKLLLTIVERVHLNRLRQVLLCRKITYLHRSLSPECLGQGFG